MAILSYSWNDYRPFVLANEGDEDGYINDTDNYLAMSDAVGGDGGSCESARIAIQDGQIVISGLKLTMNEKWPFSGYAAKMAFVLPSGHRVEFRYSSIDKAFYYNGGIIPNIIEDVDYVTATIVINVDGSINWNFTLRLKNSGLNLNYTQSSGAGFAPISEGDAYFDIETDGCSISLDDGLKVESGVASTDPEIQFKRRYYATFNPKLSAVEIEGSNLENSTFKVNGENINFVTREANKVTFDMRGRDIGTYVFQVDV